MTHATKIYRPNSVSVAGWDVKNAPQDKLLNWWKWGTDLRIDAPSEAESIRLRGVLRSGFFELSATKRPGHLVITAKPIFNERKESCPR